MPTKESLTDEIARKLAHNIEHRDEIAEEQLKKAKEKVAEELKDVEPLGDLHLPFTDLLALLAVLQQNVSPSDYQKIKFVISMMYGIEDEMEFMKRLAKGLLSLGSDDVNISITSGSES